MFINIPSEETINLTIDLLFGAKPDLKISKKDLQKLFSLPQVKPIFSLMETCIIKLMGSQGAYLWHPFSPIFSWYIMKRGGLGITIMEGCFIIKGMSLIYLQFLKLKIKLFHFTVISAGNKGIYSSPWKLKKTVNFLF